MLGLVIEDRNHRVVAAVKRGLDRFREARTQILVALDRPRERDAIHDEFDRVLLITGEIDATA